MIRAEPRRESKVLPGAASAGIAPTKPAAGFKGPRSAGGRDPAVSDELASALAALAAEYAPLPVSTAPFISVKEREVAHRQRRRTLRLKLAKIGAAGVVGMGVLYLAVATLLFRAPADEALAAEVAQIAQAVALLQTSGDQPLAIAGAVPVLRDSLDPRHLRYFADITLRLRQPLYGPAQSNGTVGYRMLQESLRWAHEQEVKLAALTLSTRPPPPELPRLLQLIHRAGEPVVVRVPFEAAKVGWGWRIKPPQLAQRTVNRQFEGATLDQFNASPYLIFGVPETMADLRARMLEAREFVQAITQEVQRRADVPAVAEVPAAEPAMATPGPNAPAVTAPAPQIDPAPAVTAPDTPPKPVQPTGPFR